MNPETSADWIIAQVIQEAEISGKPLSDDDVALLRTPIWDLKEEDRGRSIELNNRAVDLVRTAINGAKSRGAATVKVRRGLSMPIEWEQHYENIYQSQLSWQISAIMQNALLGNPMAGERKPWKSR